MFINDLPESVKSSVYLFAGDTKIFRRIDGQHDQEALQSDLNELQNWSNKWLLKFHPQKCKSMTIHSRYREHPDTEYYLEKTVDGDIERIQLEKVKQEKDLGVTTDDTLTFEKHMLEKVSKANQIMGLIRRTFVYMDIQNFRWLFKALVRPHLEYAQSMWSPHRKKDMVMIENVQRRATKLVPGLKDLSYSERLKQIDLPTLVYRRLRGDMIEAYKMLNGRYDSDVTMKLHVREGTYQRK